MIVLGVNEESEDGDEKAEPPLVALVLRGDHALNDIKACNALGIDYYIFSFPEMELNVIKPQTQKEKCKVEKI